MHDPGTVVVERKIERDIERDIERAAGPARGHQDRTSGWRPTLADRWLIPLMWLAIGIITAVTTPEEAAEPPIAQVAIAELLGWVSLGAVVGLVLAARAGRASLPVWSLALGGVTAIGLASCQMFGHPVFSSTWGLTQVTLVGAGLVVSARMIARGLR